MWDLVFGYEMIFLDFFRYLDFWYSDIRIFRGGILKIWVQIGYCRNSRTCESVSGSCLLALEPYLNHGYRIKVRNGHVTSCNNILPYHGMLNVQLGNSCILISGMWVKTGSVQDASPSVRSENSLLMEFGRCIVTAWVVITSTSHQRSCPKSDNMVEGIPVYPVVINHPSNPPFGVTTSGPINWI